MSKKFLYIVRTKSRIKLRIEASNAMEAEQRVRHPAIMRELALMLSSALSDVDSVEWCCVELHAHTNLLLFQSAVEQKSLPAHLASSKLKKLLIGLFVY